jgi:hypothetical protein
MKKKTFPPVFLDLAQLETIRNLEMVSMGSHGFLWDVTCYMGCHILFDSLQRPVQILILDIQWFQFDVFSTTKLNPVIPDLGTLL